MEATLSPSSSPLPDAAKMPQIPKLPLGPAVVHVAGGIRPALFVWPVRTGVAWLEPGYLDPYGCSRPAFHIYEGEPAEADPRVIYGLENFALVFAYAGSGDDPELVPADVAECIEWGLAQLEEKGATWDAERAKVEGLLAADLELAGGILEVPPIS